MDEVSVVFTRVELFSSRTQAYTESEMKRITVSLDVLEEDHDAVVRLLQSCTNRITYNHPRISMIRWLEDNVAKPRLVSMQPMKIGASLEKLDKSGVYLSGRLAGSFDIGARPRQPL